MITNLRRGPYDCTHVTSNTCYDWMIDRVLFLMPAPAYVGNFLKTVKEFPLCQNPASHSIDQMMVKTQTISGSK